MTWKANFGTLLHWLYTTSKGISLPTFSKSDSIQTQAVGTWLQVLQVIKQSTILRSGIMWRMRSCCIFRSAWCSYEASSYSLFFIFFLPFPFFLSFSGNNLANACRRLFLPQGFSHILLLTEFLCSKEAETSFVKDLLTSFSVLPQCLEDLLATHAVLLLRLWKLTELKNMSLSCKTGKIIIRKKS